MIKEGSTVKVHYTLAVDGETVETSRGREPLTYVQGAKQVLPALEDSLEGLSEGDKASVELPPEKAYGPWSAEALQEVPKESFRDPDTLKVGSTVEGKTSQGKPFQATVAKVGEEHVTLDLNHPLAGKTLKIDVEVVEVS